MEQHTIGTYNMSFMSDNLEPPIGPNMAFASEAAFLARLYNDPDRRKYWNNAKDLINFFLMNKLPSVVGLQEMNVTNEKSGTGTDAINQMLKETKLPYKQVSGEVTNKNNIVGISIIYNTKKVGEYFNHTCVDNIRVNNGTLIGGGRPILMLLTKKGDKTYLSVSMHGAQDPSLRLNKDAFDEFMLKYNKEFVEITIKKFLTTNQISAESLAGIFIMGDFNDRYDAITSIDIIENKHLSYLGKAPKSCCYNWDSSCPDTEVQAVLKDDYKTCNDPPNTIVDVDGNKVLNPVRANKVLGKKTLGERGKIENYKYRGDKVFGFNPTTPMEMYRPKNFIRPDGISTESDHELVYATVGENQPMLNLAGLSTSSSTDPMLDLADVNTSSSSTAGGRRSRRRRGTKKRRNTRNRKNRRRTNKKVYK